MTSERDKTLAALKIAIQMEIDGKECYLAASDESGNELGRKLLRSLAAEEDIHRRKFVEIYETVSGKKDWPATDFKPDGGKKLRTIFARTCQILGPDVKALAGELDAIQMAIDKESQSYDFYKRQVKSAVYDSEREFYESLAGEEQEHHLILLDYYEYLKDPAAWFVAKEKPSLDGG
ncbi:MAG: ferritin family protein [Chloroflexota bacterium]|nr:ferritin family protein [Chloroflexota bacterium]